MQDAQQRTGHDFGCKYALPWHGGHTDAAKRCADVYNLHLTAGRLFGTPNPHVGKFIAIRLADGGSDRVLYDSYADAVRHQKHAEQWRAYIRVVPHAMTECAAESFLRTHRLFYERGWRLPDPSDRHGGRAPILLEARENQDALIAALERNDWIRLPGR